MLIGSHIARALHGPGPLSPVPPTRLGVGTVAPPSSEADNGRCIMAKEGFAARKSDIPEPVELAKAAEKQFEVLAETQKDMFDTLMKMNQHWMTRAAAEAKSVTDLGSKLTSARSLPDAVQAYQQWMTERTKTLAEDSQHFMADCQKFMDGVTRSLPKGWPAHSS